MVFVRLSKSQRVLSIDENQFTRRIQVVDDESFFEITGRIESVRSAVLAVLTV
jgi:hypothetical protein